MKIILAEHFGMCFGVRDAIAHAEKLAKEGDLTVLGELVHNPIVREKLAASGVREASLDGRSGIGSLPMGNGPAAHATSQRVMITAHGTSDAKRQWWRETGAVVFDGTCPLVH